MKLSLTQLIHIRERKQALHLPYFTASDIRIVMSSLQAHFNPVVRT